MHNVVVALDLISFISKYLILSYFSLCFLFKVIMTYLVGHHACKVFFGLRFACLVLSFTILLWYLANQFDLLFEVSGWGFGGECCA
jgi:hypothetical protein